MIPKKIHYCWFGGNPLPNDVLKCIKSWKKKCPDYEIIEWNESNYDINKHPFIKAAYENKAWAFVSDYARLDVIYNNGGIYLDTDVELIKSLDELLEYECYFGIEQSGNYIATGLGFGAVKNHEMLKLMLEQYDKIEFSNENKYEIACPYLNTNPFYEYGYVRENIYQEINGVKLFPSKYFDPLAPGDAINLLCNDTISIHHYSATWTSNSNRLKRKFINLIGQDKYIKIKKIIKRK